MDKLIGISLSSLIYEKVDSSHKLSGLFCIRHMVFLVMSALDEKTNEMLIKNARNTVEQSKMTAKLASGSSIKIETLETTWKTIVNGP